MAEPAIQSIEAFIARWQGSGAAERANYQLFLSELCDVLGVARPEPKTPYEEQNAYVFEKSVPLAHGTTGSIDLYKRGCFVLEAKQGSDRPEEESQSLSEAALRRQQKRKRGTAVRGTASWDTAMEKARQQAQAYARNLPLSEIGEGRPPFIVVVDVGNTMALYSEFSRSGGNYVPFPDPNSYRLPLDKLRDDSVRELLRQVWTAPASLDPARRSARVTREIANRLARLARSLEEGHSPEVVAQFLMRCLFTMFAEDVGLLPGRSFTKLLADARENVASFGPLVEELWRTMSSGGFTVALRAQIPHFNGGLFAEHGALALTADQLQLLIEAAQADWRDVEPAIFGTLLERALDPVERHKLGAHYTPRAYVERLVQPTVVEPLRAEWDGVQTAALLLADQGKMDKALAEIERFQRRLASVRILDAACGCGNFLYVTLEHLKRLEGEVLAVRQQLGGSQMLLEVESVMVTPQQFLGIEVNPRAAAIAELVLWIGYLQWHRRTQGEAKPPEPIIGNFHNIECRDAVLEWDAVEPLRDEEGRPVTRWDGRTTKPHPVTGEAVPDETARVPAYRYINPRPAEWPAADFVIGNPPFIGNKRMRFTLGDGYVDALRTVYKGSVPDSADYVMYWWYRATNSVLQNQAQRFGLITTNSITQTFNRRVVDTAINRDLSLAFAIPDHPWIDSVDGAAVRVAMTVGKNDRIGKDSTADIGSLWISVKETPGENDTVEVTFQKLKGHIKSNLGIGINIAAVRKLQANNNVVFQGVIPIGDGFKLDKENLASFNFSPDNLPHIIKPYIIGRDIVQVPQERWIIDFHGYDENRMRKEYPDLYQHLYNTVRPVRLQNRVKSRRENWWLFARSNRDLRAAIADLNRYIVTPDTSKHKPFVFIEGGTLPDAQVYCIAIDDAWILGVLQSKVHQTWIFLVGPTLEDRPRWKPAIVFDPFPFPNTGEAQKARIREIAEQLDAHRKRQQAQHPSLTLTGVYNVLEKLRAGEALTAKEKRIHEQGLVSILKQLHDDLDAAVLEAYGWPATLSDEEILERLVALNGERAAEEAQGLVRWLRPEYQAPEEVAQAQQVRLIEAEEVGVAGAAVGEKQSWPESMAEQARAVRAALAAFEGPVTPKQVVGVFDGRRTTSRVAQVAALLETLAALGQAREVGDGRFVGV